MTDRQRAALFDLPTVEAEMLHYYTLSDDDLEIIRARRRPHNRLGFALQLCALRYPGRLLGPGETIPLAVSRFIAAQLGVRIPPDVPKALDAAIDAARDQPRRPEMLRRIASDWLAKHGFLQPLKPRDRE
jgi:hypothetical protein